MLNFVSSSEVFLETLLTLRPEEPWKSILLQNCAKSNQFFALQGMKMQGMNQF
jgi:hypothetical protein